MPENRKGGRMETYKPLKTERIKIENTLCMQCEHQSCLLGRCPLLAVKKEEKHNEKV
jgi:Fe-S-cluster-containing dehydrogenase component